MGNFVAIYIFILLFCWFVAFYFNHAQKETPSHNNNNKMYSQWWHKIRLSKKDKACHIMVISKIRRNYENSIFYFFSPPLFRPFFKLWKIDFFSLYHCFDLFFLKKKKKRRESIAITKKYDKRQEGYGWIISLTKYKDTQPKNQRNWELVLMGKRIIRCCNS